MRTALQWLNEVAETFALDAFVPSNPPGCKTEILIKKIQDDAREELLEELENLKMEIRVDGERE